MLAGGVSSASSPFCTDPSPWVPGYPSGDNAAGTGPGVVCPAPPHTHASGTTSEQVPVLPTI